MRPVWGFQSQEHDKITHILVVGMKWIFVYFGDYLLVKYHFTKGSLWENAFILMQNSVVNLKYLIFFSKWTAPNNSSKCPIKN